ncbi:tRNA uridine(34) 5-carboxymethylaminomethyl modification radical SAM/GNAT enzyme Elp3 [Patescibacteria group bacterium]|nr:tRNA uridine(34) 5-carboxymethylaminomethyl modification radical SAM/GNAT enzyme Elp3 [Patescibacteria group bacterium]MBU1916322.1 tRNA uridine(34) 5-carboxymethylaminomethyl modification radical SAM/GNAT enzyme Elp3 [Patescibacteria group bacterium]
MRANHLEKSEETVAALVIKAALKSTINCRDDFFCLVRKIAAAAGQPMPPIRDLLTAYRLLIANDASLINPRLESYLLKSRIRSLSGVAVVTVLTKPYPCPGRCIYCPTESNLPKSYLANEPAAMRALDCEFDPYRQVQRRLRALSANGHPADKIELIVKGGTWSAYPQDYQQEFIKGCFDACNNFATDKPQTTKDLTETQLLNESAQYRIIGLTLETRPDHITPQEIFLLRQLGCTRIELGVQTIDDHKLELCRRGHTVAAVIRATRLLKMAGYKTDYHLMPQLPKATPESDLHELRELFRCPDFRPDMLKIYPCTVIANTELSDWWRAGRYLPYDNQALKEVIIAAKVDLPRYCRLSRIIRDIPSPSIQAGNIVTSLRQVIQREMKERGLRCNCLRCREVGRHLELLKTAKPKFFTDTYEAAGGEEYFLSMEDENREAVFAFCRLRLPASQAKHKPLNETETELFKLLPEIKDCAFIRELHTYGHLVPIDTDDPKAAQHRGYGRQLMAEAERIALQAGYKKMAVISGIGVRGYYHKLGYELLGTYMIKQLN